MLDREYVQKELDKFKRYVVQQSRSNLTKRNKNSSRRLYDSIDGVAKVNKNSISLYFEMEEHGEYQDKGVKGSKSNYVENRDTPYSYRDKMPPTRALDKWVVRKGLAPRDKNGKLMIRQGLKFAIAKSIQQKGIKASFFFTKPFESAFDKLPDDIIEAYGIDIVNLYLKTK